MHQPTFGYLGRFQGLVAVLGLGAALLSTSMGLMRASPSVFEGGASAEVRAQAKPGQRGGKGDGGATPAQPRHNEEKPKAEEPKKEEETKPEGESDEETPTSKPTTYPTTRPGAAIEFTLTDLNGKEFSLREVQGQVLLIVPVAWDANRRQFNELQRIHAYAKDLGFLVIAVFTDDFAPEARTDKELYKAIQDRYGTEFLFMARTHVKGPNIHPLFKYLSDPAESSWGREIKGPFTKFLISRDGDYVGRWEPKQRLLERKTAEFIQEFFFMKSQR